MNTDIDRREPDPAAILERVIIGGDLAPLKPAERVMYYREVCRSIGVNPLTKPFEYLQLNGRLVLYARKDCTDQLRNRDDVSITDVAPQQIGDLYVVTAKARNRKGRVDMATGAVNIKGVAGEALANAMMKSETKAKRRVTLSICGLGMLDESELEGTPGAEHIEVDPTTGEVKVIPTDPDGRSPGAAAPDGAISEAQGKRLWAIAREQLWSQDEVKDLLTSFGVDHTKEIPRSQYDAVIDKLKATKKTPPTQGKLA